MDIAYQVLGDGPTDLLVLPGPFVPIDSIDDEPSLYRFHRRLASFSRVIRLDHRGVGLSSRLAAITTLGPKFWAQDAIAVMDAVGCEQATIFAPSFHAMNGLVLAADYPERVRSLIVVNGSARPLWAPDYPVGAQVRRADPFLTVALEPDAVERGFDVLSIVAPTVAGDDVFRAWWDLAGNRAGPPSMARAVSKVIAEADVRDVLGHIEAPTLILHRVGSTYIPVGHGRYLAEHIAGSRLVELPGTDTLYWVGDTGPMLDEIEEFITGVRGGADAERMLATIMFTDIVGSSEIITAATAATLRKADELGCRSLALVAFGTGVGGFPLDDAARLMVGAVRRHRPGSLQRVVFAVHGDAAERAFSAAIQAGEDTARR
ncbi:lignin peroxidase [Mycobacterium tuberculosis]|nr:lignin peroxidase [Mycobacterium tuberculosis]CKN95742.1 lignin peroxidase [Mycobacterium tuberculosis]CKU38787.1 lignin peroxidase [Mycobacterium tuberculosis]CKV18170.1 lignin peroxidase [Mycobacterium tuberculosis]